MITLKDTENFDYEYYLNLVAQLSFLIENKINVTTSKKLKQIIGAIGMSNVLLEQGIKNKDIEVLTVAYTSLLFELETLDVFQDI